MPSIMLNQMRPCLSIMLFAVEVGEAVQELSEVLVRCDYIRFSGDEGANGVLSAEERVRICVTVINAAVCLEKDNYNAKV